jgi:hypothetical protein
MSEWTESDIAVGISPPNSTTQNAVGSPPLNTFTQTVAEPCETARENAYIKRENAYLRRENARLFLENGQVKRERNELIHRIELALAVLEDKEEK